MRDYNYRKKCAEREKRKLKIAYKALNAAPTTPHLKENEEGVEYYVEGSQSKRKKDLKKNASRKVRDLDKDCLLPKGSHYKRLYDLEWIWY